MRRLAFVVICIVLIGFSITSCTPNSLTGGNTTEDVLSGDDLIAYNLMLEVCKNADDPTNTFILSGTVTSGDTGGAIKVKSGTQIYYVIITYENGKAVCSDGEEAAKYDKKYMDMFNNDDDIDSAQVNQAVKRHWGIDD